MKPIILFTLFLFISNILISQTTIPEGEVSGNWTKAESPFLIEGHIHIPVDSTLIIEPGVEVIFQGQFELNIYGIIKAIGMQEDSILFTINDTTNFSQLDNYNTGWRGIKISHEEQPIDSCMMKYCIIEYVCPYEDPDPVNQGALWNQFGGPIEKLVFENSWIRNNKAGVYCWSGKFYLINNIMSNNMARAYSCYDNKGTVYGNIISSNKYNTETNSGGGISSANYHTFINNTICFNEADYGGGLYISDDGGDVEFYNCIIYGNEAISGEGTLAYYYWCYASFYNCVLDGNVYVSGIDTTWAEYYTNYQDIFADVSSGIYSLSPNSMAIDSGENEVYIVNTLFEHPEYDILGNPRIVNGRIDIGAIETSISHSIIDQNKQDLSIYPNPTSGSIQVDLSSFQSNEIELSIIDMGGKTLSASIYENKIIQLNISPLKRGAYLLYIKAEKSIKSQLIIKE